MTAFESAIDDLSDQFTALTRRVNQSLELIEKAPTPAADKAVEQTGGESEDSLTLAIGDLDEAVNTAVARFAAVVAVQETQAPSAGIRQSEVYQRAYQSLSMLAKKFGKLQAAVQSHHKHAAKSADTARKRHNAAQRYLDSSGYQ